MLNIVCGSLMIPDTIAMIVSMIIKAFYIVIPIILIVWGMIDLGKAVICQKEDEIKKHQKMFIKRLISAVLVYFIAIIVVFVIGILAKAEVPGMYGVDECLNKLIDY